MDRSELTGIIGILVSILAGIIGLIAQSQEPETGITLFIGLLIMIALYFIVSYPLSILRQKINQLNNNTDSIKRLKEDLNILNDKLSLRKDMEDLNVRVKVLEYSLRNKKGQIDPRWVIIVIILILLYLFLKSKGILN